MYITENGKKTYKISPFAKDIRDETQFQPGLLFKKIEEGTLKGVINFGN